MIRISASALRSNIYKLLDQVLLDRKSIEIKRSHGTIRIVPADQNLTKKLDNLEPHNDYSLDKTEELPDLHWNETWKPCL